MVTNETYTISTQLLTFRQRIALALASFVASALFKDDENLRIAWYTFERAVKAAEAEE